MMDSTININDIKDFVQKYSGAKKKLERLAPQRIGGKKVSVPAFNRDLQQKLALYRSQHADKNDQIHQMIDHLSAAAARGDRLTRYAVVNILSEIEKLANEEADMPKSVKDALILLQKPTRGNLNTKIEAALDLAAQAKSPEVRQQGIDFLLEKIGTNKRSPVESKMYVFNRLKSIKPQTKELHEALMQCQKANKNTRNPEFKKLLEAPIISDVISIDDAKTEIDKSSVTQGVYKALNARAGQDEIMRILGFYFDNSNFLVPKDIAAKNYEIYSLEKLFNDIDNAPGISGEQKQDLREKYAANLVEVTGMIKAEIDLIRDGGSLENTLFLNADLDSIQKRNLATNVSAGIDLRSYNQHDLFRKLNDLTKAVQPKMSLQFIKNLANNRAAIRAEVDKLVDKGLADKGEKPQALFFYYSGLASIFNKKACMAVENNAISKEDAVKLVTQFMDNYLAVLEELRAEYPVSSKDTTDKTVAYHNYCLAERGHLHDKNVRYYKGLGGLAINTDSYW